MRIPLAVAADGAVGAVARYLAVTQPGVYGAMRRFRMVLA